MRAIRPRGMRGVVPAGEPMPAQTVLSFGATDGAVPNGGSGAASALPPAEETLLDRLRKLPYPFQPGPYVWVTNRLQMFVAGRDFPAAHASFMDNETVFRISQPKNKWGIDYSNIVARKATPELMALFEKRIAAMLRRYGIAAPGADDADDDFDNDDDPMAEEMRMYGAPAVQMTEHCRAVLKAWEELKEAVREPYRVIDPNTPKI